MTEVEEQSDGIKVRSTGTHGVVEGDVLLGVATGVTGVWPVYDVAALRTWHTGRVVLLGDAAHATSPNAGQGASLAFEDAAELARCLRDLREPAEAFAAFERLRKERAERIVRLSRRLGRSKAPSRLGAWFRDLTLPWFLKAGASETQEKYGYVVDFDAPVPGAEPVGKRCRERHDQAA